MDYSSLVDYFEANKEQFNSNLQKWLKNLKLSQNYKAKRISTTYQILSTLAIERLKDDCKDEEFIGGMKCIQFLLNNWQEFQQVVKKNLLGNIIFQFVKHCDFHQNQRTKVTLELFLKYAFCDPNLDENIFKWVIKKITSLKLPENSCTCPEECILLVYSQLKITGYILRTFLYETCPIELITYLDSHVYEITSTKSKCCHNAALGNLLQTLIKNSLELYGEAEIVDKLYINLSANMYVKLLAMNGICSTCSAKNYDEILLQLGDTVNPIYSYFREIGDKTTFCTNNLNALLSFLRVCMHSNEVLTSSSNIVYMFELIQVFLKFYPTQKLVEFEDEVVVSPVYLPRIVNNTLSLIVTLYNKYLSDEHVCESMSKVLLDLLNTVASSNAKWDNTFFNNIKSIIKLLYRISITFSEEISDAIAEIVLHCPSNFNFSNIVEIYSFWIQKVCEKTKSGRFDLLSHKLLNKLPFNSLVKIVCTEVNLWSKVKQTDNIITLKFPNQLHNVESMNESCCFSAINFCYAVSVFPQFFACDNDELLSLCTEISGHINSKLKGQCELLLHVQLLEFMLNWQGNICKDWGQSLKETKSNSKETICVLSSLNQPVDICMEKIRENVQLSYAAETIQALSTIADVWLLHGCLTKSANMLSNLSDYLLQLIEEDDKVEKSFLYQAVLVFVNCANVFVKLNCVEAVKKYSEISLNFFNKFSKLCKANQQNKKYYYAKYSVELLQCRCTFLDGRVKDAHVKLNVLQKECMKLDSAFVKEWFSSQINSLHCLINPSLYSDENVDYKIMPLKSSLTSLFSVIGNSNAIFTAIWSNTFTNSDIPNFEMSYFPIIPICRPLSVQVHEQIQISAVTELLCIIHTISEFHLTAGDVDSLNKYLPIGLHVAKRLKLYLQEAKYVALVERIKCEGGKLDISCAQELLDIIKRSLTGDKNMVFQRIHSNLLPTDVIRFITANEKTESMDAYDVVEKQTGGIEVPSIKTGPVDLDDDDIEINAVEIEGLDDIKPSKEMSSPIFKRKSSSVTLPKLVAFEHKAKCDCAVCIQYETVRIQFNIGISLVWLFTDKHELDQGLKMCNKMSKSLSKVEKTCVNDYEIFNNYKMQILMSKSRLLSLQGKRGESIKLLTELKASFNNNFDDGILAKFNILYCQIQAQPFGCSFKTPNVELDDIINSTQGYITEETSPKSSTKEPQAIPCTPLVKKPPTRNAKSSVKKPPKTPFRNNNTIGFEIFCDEPSVIKKSLPKPNLYCEDLIDHLKSISLVTPAAKTRKSRRRIVVAESSSDDEVEIVVPNGVTKSPPNIMNTRLTAARNNRRRNGPVYTDKSPERTRGAVKETRRRIRSKVEKYAVNDESDTSLNFCIADQKEVLLKSLTTGIKNDDAMVSKECLQLLSDVSYKTYQTTSNEEEIMKAVGYHAMSIGVSYRGQSHYYMHRTQNSNACKNYKTWLQHAVETTHPKHLLTAIAKPENYLADSQKYIPEHWTICAISIVTNAKKNHLLISRIQNKSTPLHIQLSDEATSSILDEFSEILENNTFSIKNIKDKSQWWTHRRNYNRDLKYLLHRIESESLSFAKGMLLGNPVDKKQQAKLDAETKQVCKILNLSDPVNTAFVKVFLNSWYKMNASDRGKALCFLSNDKTTKQQRMEACSYISKTFKNDEVSLKRHHVVLVLDKQIQLFPWENLEMLYSHAVTRMPSFDTLILQLKLMKTLDNSVAAKGVDMNTVSYVLNPSNDLAATENRFRDWFSTAETWKGIVSRPPTSEEWIECITKYDLFIYSGHGSGSKYVHSNTISKLQGRAASFIMGCSSGALKEFGSFEPNGPALSYLIAGVPCVLSCLWTVTDKDIDRFLAKIIATWACSPNREDNLAECMQLASSNCNMRWLNGAACVIYGLPVNCQVKMKKLLDSLPQSLTLNNKK